MTEQLGLYLPLRPLARRNDPSTSHVAAARARSLTDAHQVKILDALKQGDGNIYELAKRAELTHVQVARRLPDLVAAKRIELTGEERAGGTGRPCRVWKLAS